MHILICSNNYAHSDKMLTKEILQGSADHGTAGESTHDFGSHLNDGEEKEGGAATGKAVEALSERNEVDGTNQGDLC